MKKFLLPLAFLFLLALFGCVAKERNKLAQGISFGRYEYSAFNKDGVVIAKGNLFIKSLIRKTIIGTWEIKTLASPEETGPQNGNGEIRGLWDNQNNIFFDLTPGMADNNVVLNGTFSDGVLEGKWSCDLVYGSKTGGRFAATLMK